MHSLNKELVNQGMVSWYEGYTEESYTEGYTDVQATPEDGHSSADHLIEAQ